MVDSFATTSSIYYLYFRVIEDASLEEASSSAYATLRPAPAAATHAAYAWAPLRYGAQNPQKTRDPGFKCQGLHLTGRKPRLRFRFDGSSLNR